MKKRFLFLALYGALCLLAACAAPSAPADGGDSLHGAQSGGEPAEAEQITETFRLIDGGGRGQTAVLAKAGGGAGDVYTLDLFSAADVSLEGVEENSLTVDRAPRAGALIEVTHDGMVLESYPARFANVSAVRVLQGGFDDRCALYLEVLEDLWEAGGALSQDSPAYIGADLSQTSLSESEQAAVVWIFAGLHGAEGLEATYDELVEQGYIRETDADGAEFPHWEDGLLFTITEKETGSALTAPTLAFDAEVWRSALGACFFSDCSSTADPSGHWNQYKVGAQAIS